MPTATERLELLIDAKTGGAISEIRALNASVDQTAVATTKTGGATGFLEQKLGSLGLSAGAVSTVMKTAVPVAAGFAGAALLKFGRDSVEATVNLASSIRDIQRASGATADTASRLVAIFDDYNISAEAGTRSLAKFGVNVANNKTQLADNGIQIAKNRDGTADLIGTLENAADAYKNAGSAAERDKLILDAFGKSGRDLIPILEQGSAGIQKMFADVPRGQIMTQDQIDAARDFGLAVDDLQDRLKELEVEVGTALIPTLTSLASVFAQLGRIPQLVTQPVGGLSGAIGLLNDHLNPLTNALHGADAVTELFAGHWRQAGENLTRSIPGIGDLAAGLGVLTGVFKENSDTLDAGTAISKRYADAQKEVTRLAAEGKSHTAEGAAAQKELTAAQDAYTGMLSRVSSALGDATSKTQSATGATASYADEVTRTTDLQWKMFDSSLALSNAQLGVEGASLNTESALVTYNKAIEDGSADSLEARQAHNRLEEAVLAEAVAAAEADKKQRELAGGTQTAEQATAAQRDELERMKAKFPELTPIIDDYIGRLNAIDRNIETTLTLNVRIARAFATVGVDENGQPVLITYQHGGLVPGSPTTATPAMLHGGEYVLSADVVDRIKRGAPSTGASVAGGAMSGGNPIIIRNVIELDGRVVAESTAAHMNRAGGPQIAQRAIAN